MVTPLGTCRSLLGAYGTSGNVEMGECFILQGLGMAGVTGTGKQSSSMVSHPVFEDRSPCS